MDKTSESVMYIRDCNRIVGVTTTVEEEQCGEEKLKLFSYETKEFVKRG